MSEFVSISVTDAEQLLQLGTIRLKSWKGDYLHRPDSPQGVTTWDVGVGNEWTLELRGAKVLLADRRADEGEALAAELNAAAPGAAKYVDLDIGDLFERLQHRTLAHDRVSQRGALTAQRMTSSGLAEALQQHIVTRVQEQQERRQAKRSQLRKGARQFIGITAGSTRIDTDGDARIACLARAECMFSQRRQQTGRQIIDAIKAEVFQGAQRDALAGAGKTADHRQPDFAAGRRIGALYHVRCRFIECA